MKYTAVCVLTITLAACSPAQWQTATSVLGSLLGVAGKVSDAVHAAKEENQEQGVAVREAILQAERAVYEGVALLGRDSAEARYQAVEYLSMAIAILDRLDPHLSPKARELREQAKAMLVARVADDLGRVYRLGDS